MTEKVIINYNYYIFQADPTFLNQVIMPCIAPLHAAEPYVLTSQARVLATVAHMLGVVGGVAGVHGHVEGHTKATSALVGACRKSSTGLGMVTVCIGSAWLIVATFVRFSN